MPAGRGFRGRGRSPAGSGRSPLISGLRIVPGHDAPIAVIGGDGIGPEVTAEALKVVRAAGVDLEATTEFDLGGARYLRDGDDPPRRRARRAARPSTPSCSAPSARPRSRPA